MTVPRHRTAAVVTTYRPEAAVADLTRTLHPMVDTTVVVDNTPGPLPAALVDLGSDSLLVQPEGRNTGLAAALNAGIALARRAGAQRVVLWDQDSLPHPDYLDEIDAAVAGRPDVVAGGVRAGHGVPGAGAEASEVVRRLIISGLVVPLAVLERVGPFREDFSVDAVDTEFCLRARREGVELLRVPSARFDHVLGDPTAGRRVLGTRRRSSGHPPWRQYWIARNEAIVMREHRGSDPEAVSSMRRDRLDWFGRVALAGPRRRESLVAAARGLRDARSGRVDPRYAAAFGGQPR